MQAARSVILYSGRSGKLHWPEKFGNLRYPVGVTSGLGGSGFRQNDNANLLIRKEILTFVRIQEA